MRALNLSLLAVLAVGGMLIIAFSHPQPTADVVAKSPLVKVVQAFPVKGDYDLNGDGRIDVPDTVVLQRVLDGSALCPAGKDCDVNGDGVVNAQDLAQLNLLIVQRPDIQAQPLPQTVFWPGATLA